MLKNWFLYDEARFSCPLHASPLTSAVMAAAPVAGTAGVMITAGVENWTLNCPSVMTLVPEAEVFGVAFKLKENVPEASLGVSVVKLIVPLPL